LGRFLPGATKGTVMSVRPSRPSRVVRRGDHARFDAEDDRAQRDGDQPSIPARGRSFGTML